LQEFGRICRRIKDFLPGSDAACPHAEGFYLVRWGNVNFNKALERTEGKNVAAGKRTIVKVETHSFSVIHPAGSSVDVWCEQCADVAPMVTPEHAAQLCNTTPRAIYRRIETGELHFTEIAGGDLLVCVTKLNSVRL